MNSISSEDARSIIINTFNFLDSGDGLYLAKTMISDHRYTLLDKQFVKNRFINHTSLSSSLYKKEVFDCDDYCLMAKAISSADARISGLDYPYSLGYIMTDVHATNLFIDTNYTVQLVDFWKSRFLKKDQSIETFLVDVCGEWLTPESFKSIYI